jgi:hypothetical protein
VGAAPPLESRCADTTADAPALTGVSVRRHSRAADTCLPLGGPVATPWRPPGDPLSPPGDPAASCTTGTVTCVAPNAMSTVCPSLPVRSCWCVRGHRPTLALVDGAYRLSRAKSRTLSLTLTVPYIYKNYDTMLTISEHLCVGLMVSL